MMKTIIIIGLLSLGFAFNSYAHDSDRIDQLEREIHDLKVRISKLESLLTNPSTAQEVVATSEGWKSITNWRKIATGMGTSDVRKILGEPYKIDGGTFASWYYQNGGRIIFYKGKIDRWMEPQQ